MRKIQPAVPGAGTTRPDVYQLVTDRIIAALESDLIPWKKPWHAEYGLPRNYVSGRAYTGINAFLLHVAGTGLPFFLTFKQAKALGGSIRKGAKGLPVIYYNQLVKQDPESSEETKRIPFIRYYTVFGIEDVEGVELTLPAPAAAPTVAPQPLTQGEAIVKGYAARPMITYGGSEAFYHPRLDYVRVPTMNRFRNAEGYYATLFHELVHSTGHAKRLNRTDLAEALQPVGSSGGAYAREELTAEMGAAFLCAHAGFDPAATLSNAAAYIKGWLQRLREDKKLVVQAAGRAQRAAELILGGATGETETDATPEGPEPTPPAPAAPAGQLPPPEPGPEHDPKPGRDEIGAGVVARRVPVGPPPASTLVLHQYAALKGLHPDALLLFRVGDYYEAFGTDAVTLSEVLTLPLSPHGPSLHEWTGFQAAELEVFLPRLTRAGHRVAICNEVELPPLASYWPAGGVEKPGE